LHRFGRIDIAICNAGIYLRHLVREARLEEYEQCMAVNFYGTVRLVRAVLPHMLERRSGHIVVVSSVDGKKGLPLDVPYVASKFALVGFADVLRQELRGTGVHASTILPGRVDTPMIDHLKVPFVSAKISPERVAVAIIQAIRHKRAETIVPSFGPRMLVIVSSILPRLGDWLVRIFRLEGSEETTQCE
jgi:short-subunit dehydrogenase